jgi:hypothetical protein
VVSRHPSNPAGDRALALIGWNNQFRVPANVVSLANLIEGSQNVIRDSAGNLVVKSRVIAHQQGERFLKVSQHHIGRKESFLAPGQDCLAFAHNGPLHVALTQEPTQVTCGQPIDFLALVLAEWHVHRWPSNLPSLLPERP